MFIFRKLENLLYSFRDGLWAYPQVLFFGEESFLNSFNVYYLKTRPFSHVVSITLAILMVVGLIATDVKAFLRVDDKVFIEGVVVGVDERGELQEIHRINPLINTNVQLEKDLNELIYESLVVVDQNNEVVPGLADFVTIVEGQKYQFKLKEGLYWQDGVPVTTEDVKRTFELVQDLEEDSRTSTLYSRAATKMQLKIIDARSFEIELNSVVPAFFEAISFKIMPAHLFGNLNPVNITTQDPLINRSPIGTGPYKLVSATNGNIELIQNEYYRGNTQFERVRIELFADEESAVVALKSGQIHALTGVSLDSVRELSDLSQFEVKYSNIIYNQYWALYFNLGSNGKGIFKNKKVRQAISSAINKELIIESILGYGAEALGPIPVNSFAYTEQQTYEFNPKKAKLLLEEAGWTIGEGETVRSKGNKKLEMQLTVVDNPDRIKIAEVIKQDLADVGIEVEIVAKSLQDIEGQDVAPKLFDTLLFGVETFIDPDRYELFHSSQIEHPGLNISSYSSKEKVLAVIDNETKKIPISDDALDDARKIIDKDSRKMKYDLFLNSIAEDVPAIFLFHPIEVYIVNQRVNGIDLSNINSIEERFKEINNWKIELN